MSRTATCLNVGFIHGLLINLTFYSRYLRPALTPEPPTDDLGAILRQHIWSTLGTSQAGSLKQVKTVATNDGNSSPSNPWNCEPGQEYFVD